MISNANPAAISLKNGRTKYGFLLNFTEDTSTTFEFLCNSKSKQFETSFNLNLIENIPTEDILSIDTYLK